VLVTCWSVKGGSGTTVVAAALSVLLSRRSPDGAVLVDIGGDAATALGLPEPAGPGVLDWLAAPAVDAEALARLEVAMDGGLRLLHPGAAASHHPTGGEGDAERLLTALENRPVVVIDAGPPSDFSYRLAGLATVSLLVVRPCYLSLRRALAAPVRPSGLVLVEEPKRSLDVVDVEDVLGVPVRAVVPWDAAIARSVDAGLLGRRLPACLASALRAAA
jgi:cellulose biosynthesis protein BcsQ